ncbi:MAG TPA: hypothetical protein DIU00_13490 [Phycisphaerales bacterium]|nr:hypothetical protein [Phycisphaerales bacterium]
MKRYVLMSVLLVSMFACPAVLSQEFEPEDMEIEMEMRERAMEMEQNERKMDMEREMHELEMEQRRLELERAHNDDDDDDGEGALGFLFLLCAVVHILVAVWVYMDIRQLNRGSGIWIVIALLTGLLGALVYAVVRLGNGRQKGA